VFHLIIFYISFLFLAAKVLFFWSFILSEPVGGDRFFPVFFQLYLSYGAEEGAGLFPADLETGVGIAQ
jgi:hypothetical protein